MSDETSQPIEGEVVAPLGKAEAQRLTAEIRDAIKGVQDATVRLSVAVKRAHDAKVWVTLGYPSWKAYAKKEFGVGKSHAYRLVNEAVTTEELAGALVELGMLSPAGDSAVLDELTGRDWRDIKGRAEEVARLVASRAGQADGPLTGPVLRDLVLQAVREVRVAPARPQLSAAATTDDVERDILAFIALDRARAREIGDQALAVAPGYLSDHQAAARITSVVEQTGESPDYVLACRRYAVSGDDRALAEFAHAEEVRELINDYRDAAFGIGDATLAAAPLGTVPDEQLAQTLLALDKSDPNSLALTSAFRELRAVQRRVGDLALTVYPEGEPWEQGACDRLSELADELQMPFGEVFAARLYAISGDETALRSMAEAYDGATLTYGPRTNGATT